MSSLRTGATLRGFEQGFQGQLDAGVPYGVVLPVGTAVFRWATNFVPGNGTNVPLKCAFGSGTTDNNNFTYDAATGVVTYSQAGYYRVTLAAQLEANVTVLPEFRFVYEGNSDGRIIDAGSVLVIGTYSHVSFNFLTRQNAGSTGRFVTASSDSVTRFNNLDMSIQRIQ